MLMSKRTLPRSDVRREAVESGVYRSLIQTC